MYICEACGTDISIHALREEGDQTRHIREPWKIYFYPRPPRGGRQYCSVTMLPAFLFLSTPSARRATVGFQHDGVAYTISIHALREEGDWTHSDF